MLLASQVFSHGKILDFSLRQFSDPFNNPAQFAVWQQAFNSSPELSLFFVKLKNDLNLTTVIETGTWEYGRTTKFLAQLFSNVITIEFNGEFYQKAVQNLQNFSNIHCIYGRSEKVLKEILPNYVNTPVLFYLDAHWYENWPLLDELEAISVTHRDNCIIIIDDFKVPGRSDIEFDAYGDKECSFEYIHERLDIIFSEYDSYYLLPKKVSNRAKFVALPKKWNFQP